MEHLILNLGILVGAAVPFIATTDSHRDAADLYAHGANM
jgi:hypothetical protein